MKSKGSGGTTHTYIYIYIEIVRKEKRGGNGKWKMEKTLSKRHVKAFCSFFLVLGVFFCCFFERNDRNV